MEMDGFVLVGQVDRFVVVEEVVVVVLSVVVVVVDCCCSSSGNLEALLVLVLGSR